ncbi:hypothetical protein QWJ34_15220 [Saccharibacillus sp. CPCC 101409]|uniref:hypothetical protein n=1 Tax=Saccharibacillus sp. CPCC 101409 TaxID=3058041 RepID=UPI0026731D6E|nr:hypothetical protein [Saccharibacillus sp. CPCC 101409]MDO3411115.1 hypothetical protein [Saccharibacillus sp. CPCC 101409]
MLKTLYMSWARSGLSAIALLLFLPLAAACGAGEAEVAESASGRTVNTSGTESESKTGSSKSGAQRGGASSDSSAKDAASKPSGLYASHSLDLNGGSNCGGVCWSELYFVDDTHVVTELPEGGVDDLDCSSGECATYRAEGGKLELSSGETYSLAVKSNGDLTLDGEDYIRYKPLARLELDGTYRASGYAGGATGGRGVEDVYVFRADGTFTNRNWTGVASDGSENGGDGTGTSTTIAGGSEASGAYSVSGYTLNLTYEDGKRERKMFFASGQDYDFLRIGSGDYVLEEPIAPYQNVLVEEGMADKEVFKERTPNFKESLGGIELELVGYQWANLTIKEAYQKNFSDFEDSGAVELTLKYTIANRSGQTVDLDALNNTMELSGGLNASLQETTAFRPKTDGRLKPGARAERLAVFLFPADLFDEIDSMSLTIGNMRSAGGRDLFEGNRIEFSVFD